MKQYKIFCPFCRNRLEGDCNLAGKIVTCPECNKLFLTPPVVAWTKKNAKIFLKIQSVFLSGEEIVEIAFKPMLFSTYVVALTNHRLIISEFGLFGSTTKYVSLRDVFDVTLEEGVYRSSISVKTSSLGDVEIISGFTKDQAKKLYNFIANRQTFLQ